MKCGIKAGKVWGRVVWALVVAFCSLAVHASTAWATPGVDDYPLSIDAPVSHDDQDSDGKLLAAQSLQRTRSEAMDWVRAQVGRGFDWDGAWGNQCMDFIAYYYEFLGVPVATASYAADYTWSWQPDGMTRIQGVQPQAGDVLVYTSTNGVGHVAIYESDSVTYHQNYNDKAYVSRETFPYNNMAYFNDNVNGNYFNY